MTVTLHRLELFSGSAQADPEHQLEMPVLQPILNKCGQYEETSLRSYLLKGHGLGSSTEGPGVIMGGVNSVCKCDKDSLS